MYSNTSLIINLQGRLESIAEPKTKEWWERYLKHVISFRGVKMANIRKSLHAWIEDEEIDVNLSAQERRDIALDLFREPYAEDKLAGILYLQEVLIPNGMINCQLVLPRFATLFEHGFIYDWNTCDWFCVKVLGPLAEQQGESCAHAIANWKNSSTLWQRRAAGVAFVNLAKQGEKNFHGFTEMLLSVCAATVQSPERFAQTGTGWVLRELSLAEQDQVIMFLETHLEQFSREGLRYASEKLPTEIKVSLQRRHRQLVLNYQFGGYA